MSDESPTGWPIASLRLGRSVGVCEVKHSRGIDRGMGCDRS